MDQGGSGDDASQQEEEDTHDFFKAVISAIKWAFQGGKPCHGRIAIICRAMSGTLRIVVTSRSFC